MPGPGNMKSAAISASMRRLRIGGAALLLAILTIVSSAGPALGWAGSSFGAGDEQLLFTLTNQDRVSAGLNALVNDSYLHKEAEWRAKDMATRDYFSHTIPPNGLMVFDYMQKDHYCFKVAGENIGVSSWGDDVATTRIEKAFMKSTSHRANILGSWGRLGVGAYKAADGDKFYAVLFSVPCAAAKPKPTAKPTPKLTAKPTVKPTTNPDGGAQGQPDGGAQGQPDPAHDGDAHEHPDGDRPGADRNGYGERNGYRDRSHSPRAEGDWRGGPPFEPSGLQPARQ